MQPNKEALKYLPSPSITIVNDKPSVN